MLDTILAWIYTVLNWFRSPLRQIPTQTTEASMEPRPTDEATGEQPQHREGQQAAVHEGVTTTHEHDERNLVHRVPGELTADNDEDIHLDDPPKQGLDPTLSVGGPSTADGLSHTVTSELGPVIPDDVTRLETPADHATLAARSEELNKDDDDGAKEHVVAPPPSAVATASELVNAPPGPVILPDELASKLELGQTSGKVDGSGQGGGGGQQAEKETDEETK